MSWWKPAKEQLQVCVVVEGLENQVTRDFLITSSSFFLFSFPIVQILLLTCPTKPFAAQINCSSEDEDESLQSLRSRLNTQLGCDFFARYGELLAYDFFYLIIPHPSSSYF